MMPKDERAEVLDWIGGLTIKEFVELFYEAAQRVKVWNYEDEAQTREFADSEEQLALAFMETEKDGRCVHSVQFIALPDTKQPRSYSSDSNLIEGGECECGNRLKSWAKRVLCPLCGRKVLLT